MFGRSARTNIKAAQRYKEPKPRQALLDKTWSLMTLGCQSLGSTATIGMDMRGSILKRFIWRYSHIYALI